MAVMAMPRPDLAAHRESLLLPRTEIVSRLAAILGRKLTAYIGKVKDVRAVVQPEHVGEIVELIGIGLDGSTL